MQIINEKLNTLLKHKIHLRFLNKLDEKLEVLEMKKLERKLFNDLNFVFCNDFSDNLTIELRRL